jgi:hypothetical protein
MHEFKTRLGCTLRLVPSRFLDRVEVAEPGDAMLVLVMEQPGDGRRVDVILSPEDRANLRKVLDQADLSG